MLHRFNAITDQYLRETRTQNCGLKATVIRYEGDDEITVRFQDGTEVANRPYIRFKKGQIKHPTVCSQFNKKIGRIHPKSKSRIYHTRVFGIAHRNPNGNACYYAHCPICGTHAIWTFEAIRKHVCNQELVKERNESIRKPTNDTDENRKRREKNRYDPVPLKDVINWVNDSKKYVILSIPDKYLHYNYYRNYMKAMQTDVLFPNEVLIKLYKVKNENETIRIVRLLKNGKTKYEREPYNNGKSTNPFIRCVEDDFGISLIKE